MALNCVAEDVRPWHDFYRRWARLRPPLRPDRSVFEQMQSLIEGRNDRVLLLGTTPELSVVAQRVVAVDCSETAVAFIWPGNAPRRRAVVGDWLDLPCAASSFSAAVGDGSFNCLEYPSGYSRAFAQLARVLRPGGRIAVRVFLTPSQCEPIAAACAAAREGAVGSIHALKWRLAHAIVSEQGNPNVPVRSILALFNRELADRQALRRATGWGAEDVEQIDAFDSVPGVFSFPTSAQVSDLARAHFANVRFVEAGEYELAERCPILAMDVPA